MPPRRDTTELSPSGQPMRVTRSMRNHQGLSTRATRLMRRRLLRLEALASATPPQPSAPRARPSTSRYPKPRSVTDGAPKTKAAQRRYKPTMAPLFDPSVNFKGSPLIKQMQRESFEDAMKAVDRSTTGKKPVYVKVTVERTDLELTKFETEADRDEALTRLGVIWGDSIRAPLAKPDSRPPHEYSPSETKEAALKVVIKHCKLPQSDIIRLLFLDRYIRDKLSSRHSLWKTLNLRGMNNAGERLLAAISLPRYQHYVKHINLEGAQGIEDEHLRHVRDKAKVHNVLVSVESLNLDGCRTISDSGLNDITSVCYVIMKFTMKENLLVTDLGIKCLVKNCRYVEGLNLSGCRITDESLVEIGKISAHLVSLDISRCEQVTDVGVIAVAEGCRRLKFLSLSGISGVTARGMEALSKNCSYTLTSLDLNFCSGIELSLMELLKLFPKLECVAYKKESGPW